MKKLLFLVLFLTLTVTVTVVPVTYGERVSWVGPTMFTDNTPIPADQLARMETEIEYSMFPVGPWTVYGVADNGAQSFVAPYATQYGMTTYWRARPRMAPQDVGLTALTWSEETFTRPFPIPGPAKGLVVQ